ncbi:unnamed protein product [Strongylus vulgaris]|uniref:Uncharacterized protein n=1 Tax=Strongylus vulgaris TaxID=40348 RepID=A0A3P7J3Y7_STRVU|nr:unnamed protein product [Strongylus vulgaris]
MVHLPEDAPSPRLCLVEKLSPEQEYGYNLHAEKGRGQYVGMVDKVVERIKENALRCEMLVISEEGARWYQEHGIEINLQLPNIQKVGGQTSRRGTQANGSPPPAAGWYAPSNKVGDYLSYRLKAFFNFSTPRTP